MLLPVRAHLDSMKRLMIGDHALGKVDSFPCGDREISELKTGLKGLGLELRTSAEDRQDVILDYRFLKLLLSAARDREIAIVSFARGVRVGPGVRLRRLPALYKAKKRGAILNSRTR